MVACDTTSTSPELEVSAVSDYQVQTGVVNRWNGGYQGYVRVSNKTSSAPATSFKVELSFSQTVTLDSLWGGTTQDKGSRYVIASPDHLNLKKGDTHEIGFVVRGSQATGQAKLLSINGQTGSNPSPQPPPQPSPTPNPAPVGNSAFYVNPNSPAANWVRGHASDPRAAVIRDKIANQPQGKWIGDWTANVKQEVSSYTGAAAAAGKTPIFVAYNIPGRDCGQYSSGGAGSPEAYKTWIRDVVSGIGSRSAVVILEPDALPSWSIVSKAPTPNSSPTFSLTR